MNWHTTLLPVTACCLAFLPSTACAEETIRISVSSLRGLQADGDSGYPSISADGQRIAFSSSAANLVPNYPADAQRVFLRTEGVKIGGATLGLTAVVSVASDGTPANDLSFEPALSADGQYVAFTSYATNLAPNSTKRQADVYVRDLRAQTTSIVSISSAGIRGNRASGEPSISADGRFIAFTSETEYFDPSDWNGAKDVFVRDTKDGITARVSISSGGAQGGEDSHEPAISADGRYVAFSSASKLVPGLPDRINSQIYVRDLMTATTALVSASLSGTHANGYCGSPAVSADGRYIAFVSDANNLGFSNTGQHYHVYVRDTVAGTTAHVSVPFTGGEANRSSYAPSISADGRYVAFVSDASNLVPGDFNGVEDVFVRDMVAGTTRRVSISSSGGQANQNSWPPVISADGRFVAFDSYASNLVPNDTNGEKDVFRHGPLFALTYTMEDAAQALRIAGGMVNPSPAVAERLNVVSASPGVDLRDAVSIARKAAGLEVNPG